MVRIRITLLVGIVSLFGFSSVQAQKKKPAEPEIDFPPKLTGKKKVVTDSDPSFLNPPEGLRKGVKIAKTAPTVDFLYYPRQDYLGQPWANWGDSLAVGDKYYASISDHLRKQQHITQ